MKIVGHCPSCYIPLTSQEIGYGCSKCGTFLEREELVDEAAPPVTKQKGSDLFKRNYKTMTKGVKNGGTIGHRPGCSTHPKANKS